MIKKKNQIAEQLTAMLPPEPESIRKAFLAGVEYATRWTPVEEGKPDPGEYVLVKRNASWTAEPLEVIEVLVWSGWGFVKINPRTFRTIPVFDITHWRKIDFR